MPKKSEAVPEAAREKYQAIVSLTDKICAEHLSADYAALARELAAALARKRPTPLVNGKSEAWACGVIYALGTVNFLWDKSQTSHMRADELCKLFGVSPATGSAKAKQIRNLFEMHQMDPNWTLPGLVDENPLIWLLSVNGMLMDIRYAPVDAQIVAYEEGLIPYVPALGREETERLSWEGDPDLT